MILSYVLSNNQHALSVISRTYFAVLQRKVDIFTYFVNTVVQSCFSAHLIFFFFWVKNVLKFNIIEIMYAFNSAQSKM